MNGAFNDYPEAVCPLCGDAQTDYDGFGCLYCEMCGYCTHPQASGEPLECELCGAQV